MAGRTLRTATTDRVFLAAGCAFHATLGLFPAISVLISLGRLILHPALSGLLPAPAFSLIESRVHHLVHQSRGTLGLHLRAGFLLTFWRSSTGSRSVLWFYVPAYAVLPGAELNAGLEEAGFRRRRKMTPP